MRISRHAIQRYRQRTGSTKTDESITKKLLELAEVARPVKLKKRFRVMALLNHDCKEASYRIGNGMVLVIEGETIVTVHTGQADRWEPL